MHLQNRDRGNHMFCPNCGSIMFPSSKKYICKKCTTEQDITGNEQKVVANIYKKEVATVGEKENTTALPREHVFCPKCEKGVEAYFELRQMRSADEPETKIFRCPICKHAWREY